MNGNSRTHSDAFSGNSRPILYGFLKSFRGFLPKTLDADARTNRNLNQLLSASRQTELWRQRDSFKILWGFSDRARPPNLCRLMLWDSLGFFLLTGCKNTSTRLMNLTFYYFSSSSSFPSPRFETICDVTRRCSTRAIFFTSRFRKNGKDTWKRVSKPNWRPRETLRTHRPIESTNSGTRESQTILLDS